MGCFLISRGRWSTRNKYGGRQAWVQPLFTCMFPWGVFALFLILNYIHLIRVLTIVYFSVECTFIQRQPFPLELQRKNMIAKTKQFLNGWESRLFRCLSDFIDFFGQNHSRDLQILRREQLRGWEFRRSAGAWTSVIWRENVIAVVILLRDLARKSWWRK